MMNLIISVDDKRSVDMKVEGEPLPPLELVKLLHMLGGNILNAIQIQPQQKSAILNPHEVTNGK